MPNSNTILKYVIFAILAYLFFLILSPFLAAIVLALVFTIVFYPIHKYLYKKLKINKVLSTFIVFLLTIIFIFTPIVILLGLLATEAIALLQNVDFNQLFISVENYPGLEIAGYDVDFETLRQSALGLLENVGQIAQAVGNRALVILNTITSYTFQIFVFLFVYFFMLLDAEHLLRKAKEITPFNKKETTILFKKLHQVLKAVFKGNIGGAVISGTVAYFGFWIFGIPGALIFAFQAAILSLIPTIGTLVIYGVGAAILFFTSGWLFALGLVLYFLVLEIGAVQSYLKPNIIDKEMKIHPILVFFSIVGGATMFGTMGLIYGPLIFVLFTTLFDFIIDTNKETA